MLLSAVTTPVRALVQTGGDPRGVTPANLAREGDPIGLTAEAGGFARPNHGLTTVVTVHGLRYPVEISENSRKTGLTTPENECEKGRSLYPKGRHRRRGFTASRCGLSGTANCASAKIGVFDCLTPRS